MTSSDEAGKISCSRVDDTAGVGGVGRRPGPADFLRFANPDLLALFRSVPWVRTLDHREAGGLWRTNAPRLLGEASLNEPYMVVRASEFGSLFEFYDAVGEIDNFFSEACLADDDGLCLALPDRPDERFIFVKRAALLRIGVPIA